MSPELLTLHISQLAKAFEKTKTNRYSDKRKQEYHDRLIGLFELIKAKDVSAFSYDQQKNLKDVLDFIFFSIEFLDSSTLINIPYEIVYCLEKALKDWVDTENYIIVTSLQNHILNYSFNPILALTNEYYDIIESMFGVTFNHRLIQINLPRYLVHDYLANVVLYHELGHFIDYKFNISRKLINTLVSQNKVSSEDAVIIRGHIGEYFSDIFAAQYIGNASNYYLDYVAHKAQTVSSHPSTDLRIEMVDDFLKGNHANPALQDILMATELATTKKLVSRHSKISETDFSLFIPPIIESDKYLHSIFEVGWDLWKREVPEYVKKGINSQNKYRIINNLIEKSISNYMILENWEKCI